MPEKTFDLSVFKIVSGGQSGADQSALDWAIANGVDHGGGCPKGRKSEDGKIDPKGGRVRNRCILKLAADSP